MESEISSIDTALLFGGVLTKRQYFAGDKEIPKLAAQLSHALDFAWMLNGHARLLAHGWYPERGFIANRRDTYLEQLRCLCGRSSAVSDCQPIVEISQGSYRFAHVKQFHFLPNSGA